MARKPRVDDSELENDQLKDMLGENNEVDTNDDDEQNDEGTTGDEEDTSASDDEGTGNKESASGQPQESQQRGQGDRDTRGGNQQQQRDKGNARGNQTPQQKGQQQNVDLALINKLDKNTQNAVMRQAIDFVRARTQPVFNKLDMQVRKLNNELNTYKIGAKEAQEYGLNPHERNLAYRIVAAYKKDPAALIKYLITEAKKSGHNITMDANSSQTLDLNAIRGMINEAVAPMRGEFENRQRADEARNEAAEQLSEFYGREPMAQIHEQLIHGILQRNQNETLDTAWLKVQLYATKNGLDLNVPFDQQQRRQQNNGRPMNLRGNRQQMRDVNGGGDTVHYANPNAKWGDIINETLAEHGFVVN